MIQKPESEPLRSGPWFAVLPQMVTSKNDGDRHYISEVQLMKLYRVPSALCKVISRGKPPSDLFPLRPKYHGNYDLPEFMRYAVDRWVSANNSDQQRRAPGNQP